MPCAYRGASRKIAGNAKERKRNRYSFRKEPPLPAPLRLELQCVAHRGPKLFGHTGYLQLVTTFSAREPRYAFATQSANQSTRKLPCR